MKKYVILFTPRSGSSWLTKMLKDTEVLGNPTEWINPDHIQLSRQEMQCETESIDELFTRLIKKRSSPLGIFGIEITSIHYDKFIVNRDTFQKYFSEENTKFILLTREDIVAQAVSLYKAVKTKVFHSPEAKRQMDVPFNSDEIKKWVNHILKQEQDLDRIIRDNGITPLRISYEFMCSNPDAVVNMIASGLVDVKKDIKNISTNNEYVKIGNKNNDELVSHFYQDCHVFCAASFSRRCL